MVFSSNKERRSLSAATMRDKMRSKRLLKRPTLVRALALVGLVALALILSAMVLIPNHTTATLVSSLIVVLANLTAITTAIME